MAEPFQAVKISQHVYWVGAVDWSVRGFHGYLTSRGSTYNAYLITAEKVTLVDTVKAPFIDELMSRVACVVDPERIDYIISNHSEMDHSGALPAVIQQVRPKKVFASSNGAKALEAHFHTGGEITAVADGQTISLGDLQVTFAETRMCHWPDSMVSYLHRDELLFSQDAFGMHLATSRRFADEIDRDVVRQEAAKYYANILLPLSKFVTRALEKLSGLKLGIIAPDHGPIWRRDTQEMVELYRKWARQERQARAVVAYDTMWNSTAAMAAAIGEGIAGEGLEARLMPLRSCHRSDVAAEILQAGGLIVGTPTINNTMFPTVADMLAYLKGLAPRGLIGAAFGSYGWNTEGQKQLAQAMADMNVQLVSEPLCVRYVPDQQALGRCRELGRQIASRLEESFSRDD